MIDRTVLIKIIRSDKKEFVIDGTDWALPSNNGLDGFGTFENDITTVDNAVGDGGIITSDRIAQKDRTIVAVSRNNALNDVLRHKATAFFNSKFTYKIYITYMGYTRWCEGKIYKFKMPNGNIYRSMTMTVTFLCPDPYLKSYEDFGKNIASVLGMCGFPYLCSVTAGTPQGITGGIFNFANQVLLENDGDVETLCRAIFIANGAVTNPKLVVNDNYVRVIDVMTQGDIIEIDFTKNPPTVKKNGENYIGHCDRTSAFDDMSLPVGDSAISFTADDGANQLDVSIYYNKLYGAM